MTLIIPNRFDFLILNFRILVNYYGCGSVRIKSMFSVIQYTVCVKGLRNKATCVDNIKTVVVLSNFVNEFCLTFYERNDSRANSFCLSLVCSFYGERFVTDCDQFSQTSVLVKQPRFSVSSIFSLPIDFLE